MYSRSAFHAWPWMSAVGGWRHAPHMSTSSISYRPVLSILMLELPALPVITLFAIGVPVSLALGNGAILGWIAITVAALNALILGAFVVGGKRLRPVTETSLLAQLLAPLGRFVTRALGMVVGGFFGAIIAINVAADMAGSSTPGWTSELLGVVIGAAGVLGLTGSAILLGRRVLTLKPGARAKSMKRGVRRLCRAVETPVITIDERSLLVRHLTTAWYLLWLPLLTLIAAAIWLSIATR